MTTLTKKEINHIFSTGSRIFTEFFDVIFANKNSDIGKILVITSRKVGNAPKRNKLRRRLKSIFYEEKFFTQNYDIIFIAKKNAVNLDFNDLKNILVLLINKINLNKINDKN